MRLKVLFGAAGLAVLCAALVALPAFAVHGGDTLVSVGSPAGPFSQNKQNEPAVAIDANHPDMVVAGANDNIDMEACNAGDDTTCPFTEGVGGSGVYFSFDRGDTWSQPTYTGLTARNCLGVEGGSDDPPSTDFCEPEEGPIGTLPNYYENGLVSDGDPAVAFGPTPDAQGNFSWANGSRLYYANLTSNLPGSQAFKGFEAIAVSHIDGPASTGLTPAIVADQENWSDPVIASRQNSALFSDKEQIWADNAESSPYFGNAYVCFAAFQGNGAQPLKVLTSTDGGSSWSSQQVTSAANNPNSQQGFGRSGCTVRTDSEGVVYVFVNQFAFDPAAAAPGKIQMIKSFDGGNTWTRPLNIFTAYDTCNYFEPSIGRCVEDGVAGARSDLSSAPSVDIANGAPTGVDATDDLVLTWVDGRDGLNNEHVMFTSSSAGGNDWQVPREVEQGGDRGYYSAPAISPNGTDTWLVYNAFTTPFRESAVGPGNDRQLVGVVLHADVGSNGAVGNFSEVHRGESGDARGSSQNDLAAEFLGDYVYAAATRTYGAAVWNDVRNAADCPAIDEYRQALHEEAEATGTQTAEAEEPRGEEERMQRGPKEQEEEEAGPPVQQVCLLNFGNSDIYGGSYADPTP
jgi:hypothetical protein